MLEAYLTQIYAKRYHTKEPIVVEKWNTKETSYDPYTQRNMTILTGMNGMEMFNDIMAKEAKNFLTTPLSYMTKYSE